MGVSVTGGVAVGEGEAEGDGVGLVVGARVGCGSVSVWQAARSSAKAISAAQRVKKGMGMVILSGFAT
jgi:hypothetical protein